MNEVIIIIIVISILSIELFITVLAIRYIILPFINIMCYIIWEYKRVGTNFKAWQNKQQFEKRIETYLRNLTNSH